MVNFGDLGGAVQDIFGGIGDLSAAKAYGTEAKIAGEAAKQAQVSGSIQTAQEARSIYQSLGATQADVGGAGFQEGGSAQDILRSSVSQGALAKGLIATQTSINVLGYQEQQAAAQGQAAAAKANAGGGFLGGLLKIVGAVAPLVFG